MPRHDRDDNDTTGRSTWLDRGHRGRIVRLHLSFRSPPTECAMAGRLAGKVAIVTGAGSSGPGLGNGKAVAILFAREGAQVVCVDSVAERAEETVATILDEGGAASPFAADVSSRSSCERMA